MKRDYHNFKGDEFYSHITENADEFPFAFTYGETRYIGFSSEHFKLLSSIYQEKDEKETKIISFLFKETLRIDLKVTHYYTHGVTEWTVFFENVSDRNSEILQNMGAQMNFTGHYPTLKGIFGDLVNRYTPYYYDLSDNTYVEFSSDNGRTSHINFPYFNLEHGDGGAMLAIGWAGTWNAGFSSLNGKVTYTASAVNGFSSYLKPGEKIRTALFVYAPYSVRNEHFATNYWRSWFVEYNLPKNDSLGTVIKPFSTCCLAYDTGYPNSDGSISERHTTWRPSLEKMIAEDVKVDFRWVDAGWYQAPDGSSAEPNVAGHDWWDTTGTWTPDPTKWPDGTFREATDFARANGMRTLLWFEPERITDPVNLAKNHGYDINWCAEISDSNGNERVFGNNLGNPDCFDWTISRIKKTLTECRIDMYREDNCTRGKLNQIWQVFDKREGEGRKGISEAKMIAAHYRLWDEILCCTLSYGGCGFLDSCAGGGGRNDIESLRRGVPLLRSDLDRTSTSIRLSMTSTLSKWIPFCGANSREKVGEHSKTGISDKYVWRASYLPALNVDAQFVMEKSPDFDNMRFGLKEWRLVSEYLLKEFYPLTVWHPRDNNTDFTAYAYYDPEKEKGILFVFRQENCVRNNIRLQLPFAKGKYILTDEDSKDTLITEGNIEIFIEEKRTAKLIRIEKITG